MAEIILSSFFIVISSKLLLSFRAKSRNLFNFGQKYISMKRILGVIVAVLSLTGCINEKIEGADLKVGDMIPEFSVVMNDGTSVSDKSLIGNVSFIMFFHTSCPDCQATLPVVKDIYEIYTSKGVRFALISREQQQDDKGSVEGIESYWTRNNLTMPYSAQRDRKVYNKFAGSRIPRVYICDKDGIIRYIFTDDPIPTYNDLISSLESLIR